MSQVQACLQPLTPCAGDTYSGVSGSCPNWQQANLADKGRRHLTEQRPRSELGTGFEEWYRKSDSGARPLRRHLEQPTSSVYAEPCVQTGHRSYFGRRAVAGNEPEYRRAQKAVPAPLHVERPEGKRAIPEPYGPPPTAHGRTGLAPPPDDVRHRVSDTMPEPAIPRLGRPAGAISGLRESASEDLVFRLGRKGRVGPESYQGLGRGGDLSLVYGASRRVEDDPGLFHTNKQSQTFLRFCATLSSKPAVSPHQRRQDGEARRHTRENSAVKELVAQLDMSAMTQDDE